MRPVLGDAEYSGKVVLTERPDTKKPITMSSIPKSNTRLFIVAHRFSVSTRQTNYTHTTLQRQLYKTEIHYII